MAQQLCNSNWKSCHFGALAHACLANYCVNHMHTPAAPFSLSAHKCAKICLPNARGFLAHNRSTLLVKYNTPNYSIHSLIEYNTIENNKKINKFKKQIK